VIPVPEQMMVVSIDGGISPMPVEGHLGGDTGSSDSEEEDVLPEDVSLEDEPEPESELLVAARLDNRARVLKAQKEDWLLSAATLPAALVLAMESAEVCGRTGEEKQEFAREIVTSMCRAAPGADLESLAPGPVLEAWMTAISDAAKGRLEINRPSRRYRWLGACIDSLRRG